jgi:hypothetical protein
VIKDYDKKQYQGYPEWLNRENTEQKNILETLVGDLTPQYEAHSSAGRI